MRDIAAPLRRLGRAEGLSEGDLIDLELAAVEAANNIVLHGGRAEAEIQVVFRREDDCFAIDLTDQGTPIPAQSFDASLPSPLDAECGRGFGIIRACVDDLRYEVDEVSNRLTLLKRIRR